MPIADLSETPKSLFTDALPDRDLKFVAKKGRPVSQCQKCRHSRKVRASHTSCECGSKPHDEGDHLAAHDGIDAHHPVYKLDSGHTSIPTCCCSHGGSCTCCNRKHHPDTVLGVETAKISKPAVSSTKKKPTLKSVRSESSLVSRPRQRPVHRHNDSAHTSGAPYTVPRPHSIHAPPNLERNAPIHPSYHPANGAAQWLEDTFTGVRPDFRLISQGFGTSSPELGLGGPTNGPADDWTGSTFPQVGLSRAAELSGLTAAGDDGYSYPPAWELGQYLSAGEVVSLPSTSSRMSVPDLDAFQLPIDSSLVEYGPALPYAPGNSNLGHPELTSSSSASDAEEYMHMNQGSLSPALTQSTSRSLAFTQSQTYASSVPGYFDPPLISDSHNSHLDHLGVDDFIRNSAESPSNFEGLHAQMATPQYLPHAFTIRDAQKLAHTSVPTEAMGGLSLPQTVANGLSSAMAFGSEDPSLDPENLDEWFNQSQPQQGFF